MTDLLKLADLSEEWGDMLGQQDIDRITAALGKEEE